MELFVKAFNGFYVTTSLVRPYRAAHFTNANPGLRPAMQALPWACIDSALRAENLLSGLIIRCCTINDFNYLIHDLSSLFQIGRELAFGRELTFGRVLKIDVNG